MNEWLERRMARWREGLIEDVARGFRAAAEWPRRSWPEVPFLASWIADVDARLALGQEAIPPGERDLIDRTIDVLVARQQKQYPVGVRPMLRDFHAKAHGCLIAKFKIDPDVPADYRFGLFASVGRELDAIARFSNGTRQIQPDNLRTIHGLAIKVLEVPVADGKSRTHDFLLADFPVNFIADVAAAYDFYRLEAADQPQTYMASVLPPKLRLRIASLMVLAAPSNVRDVFDLDYYSQTPYRLGPRAACKYIVRPYEPSGLAGDPPPRDDYLRDRIVERLNQLRDEDDCVSFDFFVQRQIHPVRQPVEDASWRWDESEAQPVRVATLSIRKADNLDFFSASRQWRGERLAFNPDNAFADSAPLGGINRLRRRAYERIAEMRHRANAVRMHEPTSIQDFLSG